MRRIVSLEKDRLIYIIDNELLLRQGNDCEVSCNNRKYEIYLYTVVSGFFSVSWIVECNSEFEDTYLKKYKEIWGKRGEIG